MKYSNHYNRCEFKAELRFELGYHLKINREIAKTCRKTRENSGKSRKNACHYSLISFCKSFPFMITCNFPSLCKVWANLKMVFLRYEFFKNRGVFPQYLGQFCRRHSIEREILRQKCIFSYFLEQLELGASKLSKRSKNKAEKMKKLEKFKEAATLAF